MVATILGQENINGKVDNLRWIELSYLAKERKRNQVVCDLYSLE
ncbi:hypothetical protein [cyanobacterium endosymbiont of Rhopalodia gibberula]|nr:hypothetical protein [cyanobacterium endosymbiont of Rhopalodia gibberula]